MSTEMIEKQAAEEIKDSDECVAGLSSEDIKSKTILEPQPYSSITSHHPQCGTTISQQKCIATSSRRPQDVRCKPAGCKRFRNIV